MTTQETGQAPLTCPLCLERKKEDALHVRMIIGALCFLIPLAVVTAVISS